MKTKTKKMAAEITSALTEATLVKSSGKKIMKRIDATAKKLAKKINNKIKKTTAKTKKNLLKKELKVKKTAEKLLPESTAKGVAKQPALKV
ncbi:MAG: hypothetical protein ABIQ27_02080 [Flavobacterium sp.]|uniref:hypothetical protein n=1 Tax=Flavobacterium sp. TaxID=239 RepID=UPI0032647176